MQRTSAIRARLRAFVINGRWHGSGSKRTLMWQTRKMPQMHELLDREDPYSYYRGQSEAFANITNQEKAKKTTLIGVPLIGIAALAYKWYLEAQEAEGKEPEEGEALKRHTLTNWSGTQHVTTKTLHQPQTLLELEQLVATSHANRTKLRVTGAGLSPNGISFERGGMVSLALMDQVLHVDTWNKRVTVQAGARVSQVLEALRPHGLTLENLASINEQQLGGFVQVSAHGTGATIPPVDNQLVSMKLVTPGMGTIVLNRDDPEQRKIFDMCKVGLGMQGIVAEVTLQCVPAHQLVERTWVSDMDTISRQHENLLRANRHLRYMWIPYTDKVVVVASNKKKPWYHPGFLSEPKPSTPLSDDVRLAPMRDLLVAAAAEKKKTMVDMEGLSLAALRDELLQLDPLSVAHVRRVNAAEAACWAMSEGVRVDWTDRVLGFECGGQQWVSEVAFPAGFVDRPSFSDLSYTKELLKLIEVNNIPAPAPLEQRWSSSSSSPMSPASSTDPTHLFSWLGIIMYLPPDDEKKRTLIANAFQHYKKTCAEVLWEKYGCSEHWAKIDVRATGGWGEKIKSRIRARYPIGDFNVLRARTDPNNILASEALTKMFSNSQGA